MKNSNNELSCRLNKVGGQAVLEGVMMKAGSRTVTTCRKEDGSLVVFDDTFTSVRKKCKILNLPFIRGIVNFIEMLTLSFKTLEKSAEAFGIEEEAEKNKTTTAFIMAISLILSVVLALGLFMFLPILTADLIDYLLSGRLGVYRAVVEGVAKTVIFILYLWLVSLMKDIKRTFMYHGAEHKTIACFEAGLELTPENAMRCKRFHPRCGTSFMFLMILLGIVAGFFLRFLLEGLDGWVYYVIRLAIFPFLVGAGFELIMIAGKHDNCITRAISAPGLWVQRITTKEPTEDMLEVAIISTKCALREDFPEFMEFYNERSWEKKDELVEEGAEDNEGRDASNTVTEPTDGEANATESGDGEANTTEPGDGEAKTAEVADIEANSSTPNDGEAAE